MFRRVAAHCAGGGNCGSDAALCDGAPAFQRAGGGAVLYRGMISGSTVWRVGPSERLGDCNALGYYRDLRLELATFTFAAGCGGLRVE